MLPPLLPAVVEELLCWPPPRLPRPEPTLLWLFSRERPPPTPSLFMNWLLEKRSRCCWKAYWSWLGCSWKPPPGPVENALTLLPLWLLLLKFCCCWLSFLFPESVFGALCCC